MHAFLEANPASAAANKIVDARFISSGFADSTFGGLNAFYFISQSGVSTPVRWTMEPLQQVQPFDATSTSGHWRPDCGRGAFGESPAHPAAPFSSDDSGPGATHRHRYSAYHSGQFGSGGA
jgi:hypothetical protein